MPEADENDREPRKSPGGKEFVRGTGDEGDRPDGPGEPDHADEGTGKQFARGVGEDEEPSDD